MREAYDRRKVSFQIYGNKPLLNAYTTLTATCESIRLEILHDFVDRAQKGFYNHISQSFLKNSTFISFKKSGGSSFYKKDGVI